MNERIGVLAGGFLLDLIFGEIHSFPHPVKFIGKFVKFSERRLYKKGKIGGFYLLLLTLIITGGIFYIFSIASRKLNPFSSYLFQIVFFYFGISLRGLLKEGKKIESLLSKNEIGKARKNIKSLVSRNTEKMDKKGLIRGTIESLAENTSDGVIAPSLFFLFGGIVGMWLYKAVNTLDSMVGYRNEKYKEFGYFPARMDDIANFIPSRITGLLISFSFITPGKIFSSFSTMIKDAKKHPSPNAGYPEASLAGGLGVRLGGINFYNNKEEFRPYLGVNERELEPEIIKETGIRCSVSVLLFLLITFLLWR